MSENTSLLQHERNGSTSSANSSNVNDESNLRRPRPKNYYSFDGESKRRSYQSIPNGSAIAPERDVAWVKNQREFIYRSGKKASLRKRLAFKCDTSRAGRLWEIFDAILSAMFVILYVWVSV